VKRAAAALLLALASGLVRPEAGEIAPAAFSAAMPGTVLPAPWMFAAVAKIKRHTRYTLERDDGVVVLRAEAQASMASLTHALDFDPRRFPVIQWRWKVANLLRNSDLASKRGDDFPARVYVLFDYDIGRLPFAARVKMRLARALYGADVPTAALCYVWDGKAPIDTSVWSPYTDRVRVIVAESGPAHLGKWVTVRRDIVEDFRRAFGEDPPRVSGVAIATDTDDTGESATAWYGDIRFTQ
jgi:hypothetical protein